MTNGPKQRVLVVDDEKSIRNLLARIAERAGFRVDTAQDGIEALELLEKHEYIIAIVDLMMPRLSGYELVQRISALTPRPIVLVATAMANSDVASLDDSMVRRVIRKPFDVQAVANALVETARQVAEQQGLSADSIVVAPPEAAKIPVVAEPPPQPQAPPAIMATEEEEVTPIEEESPPVPKVEDPPLNGQ